MKSLHDELLAGFGEIPRENACVLYGRLSRGDDSLEAQNRRMFKYRELLDEPAGTMTPLGAFEDPDTTGDTEKVSIAERDGGAQVVALLNSGRVGHLIIPKLDRIARRARGFLNFYHTYMETGKVILHIVDFSGSTLCTSGAQGKMFLTMMVGFSEWDLENIRKNTKNRLDDMRGQQELVGSVPYGWNAKYIFADGFEYLSPKALFWGGKRGGSGKKGVADNQDAEPIALALKLAHGLPLHRRMVDNLEEQGWLRHMDQLLKGGLSFAKIANDMNRRGLKTKLGNPWNFGGVKKILVGDDDATRPTAAREWLDRDLHREA